MFLDGHISEMHKHVVQLTGAGCVLHRAEPAEPQFVPNRSDQTDLFEFIFSVKHHMISWADN